MSDVVINVDMVFSNSGNDSVVLKRVEDASQRDITDLYKKFCKENGYDLSNRSDIENAAHPFVEKFKNSLP